MRRYNAIAKIVIASFLVFGCAGGKMMHENASLYTRLGGMPAIEAVVEDFVGRLGSDTRITNEKVKARFAAIDIAQLKKHLANQICAGAGGPCNYGGRNMKDTHAGLKITSQEFDFTVEDLVATLNKFKVPEKEKSELLGLLGPMKKDIVQGM